MQYIIHIWDITICSQVYSVDGALGALGFVCKV